MKEFNLELAKAGKPVCTRDGRPVRIICWDRKGMERPIIALLTVSEEEEVPVGYMENGEYFPTETSELDLMMAEEKKEGWINIYNIDGEYLWTGSVIHPSREDAEETGKDYRDYITTIKIKW